VRTAFGADVAADTRERALRFLEEALELAQAVGLTAADVNAVASYTMQRPPGDVEAELGGAMLTLHALASAAGLNADGAAEKELERVVANTEMIVAKHAGKPATIKGG